MKIVIVGAGIRGLTLAWALRREGHAVTLLEQSDIPNPDNASFDQHRLIHDLGRIASGLPTMTEAFEAWEVLACDIGRFYVETGAVRVYASASEATSSFDRLRRAGVECWLLDDQSLREALPALRLGPACVAVMTQRGGVLLADRVAIAMASWLVAHGVNLRPRTRVERIDVPNASAVIAGGDIVRADLLLIAAGPWTAHALPSLAGRVGARRQIVTYVEPPPHLEPAWRRSPIFVDLGNADELWGAPPVAGTTLKLAAGCLARTASPSTPGEQMVGETDTQALLARYREHLIELEAYRMLRTAVCFYSTERDGNMICEPVDGDRRSVWVIAGCDGSDYKLAPALALSANFPGRQPAADGGARL